MQKGKEFWRGAGAEGLEIGDVLREKITYGSFFVIILNSLVREEENTTDIHIRLGVEGWEAWPIDGGGWGEIHINRKFCLFLWAAHSQNSK